METTAFSISAHPHTPGELHAQFYATDCAAWIQFLHGRFNLFLNAETFDAFEESMGRAFDEARAFFHPPALTVEMMDWEEQPPSAEENRRLDALLVEAEAEEA